MNNLNKRKLLDYILKVRMENSKKIDEMTKIVRPFSEDEKNECIETLAASRALADLSLMILNGEFDSKEKE